MGWTLALLVAAGFAGLHTFGVPGIQWLLPIALWILAAGSLVTLLQRVVPVRRESAEAEAAARAFEAHGHKQTYWVEAAGDSGTPVMPSRPRGRGD